MALQAKKGTHSTLNTRVELLDAAEELFAENGVDGVSIRDIVKRANSALSAINYHFGSKEMLLLAVLSRRADEIADERMDGLSKARKAPKAQRLRQILSALLKPMMLRAINDEPGWRNYLKLLAHVAQFKELSEKGVADRYNETAAEFIDAIAEELPGVPRDDITIAFVLCVGSWLHIFAQTGRLESLSDSRISSQDFTRLEQVMMPFFTSAFRGLTTEASPNRK